MEQADSAETATPLPMDHRVRTTASAATVCIHHSGRAFVTSSELAGVFLRSVQHHVNHGRAELVPLLHSRGVDLLFVGARTPLIVHDSRDRSLDRARGGATDSGSHPGFAA